jgi:hypothetical protein
MFRRTGLASALAVAACWGQNYPNQQRLQQVTAWKGTVKVALTASQVVEPSVDNAKFSANDLTVFTVNLGQVEAEWIGTATGTYTVDETLTSSTVCDGVLHGVGSWAVSTSLFQLGFDVDSDTFSLLILFPTVLTMNLTDTATCFGVTTTSTRPQQLVWLALGDEQGLPIPATGFALQGSKDVKGTSAMGFEVDYTITWDLTPSTKDLEVVVELGGYDDWRPTATWDATIPGNTIPVAVVEPDGYLDWRPTATRDATMPGNTIPVKATLRYTDGTSPQIDADKAQKFIFELLETSQEPGIAMNWPRDASDKDYDLRFAPANAIAFDDPTARQRAEFVPASPQTTASITIQSFDWGGWSRLKVTAELPGPGGRTITGHLLGDETQTEVRLPKRLVSSRIADAWKVAHKGITAADSSDDDGLPAGDGNSGDGLTLYEEYRGFYENQVHIEGDPTKKDYFAVNLAGKAGDGGLALFQTISGMAVHSNLLQTELSFDRVINKNVRAAPHRVDQHGVIVKVQASFVGFALAARGNSQIFRQNM